MEISRRISRALEDWMLFPAAVESHNSDESHGHASQKRLFRQLQEEARDGRTLGMSELEFRVFVGVVLLAVCVLLALWIYIFYRMRTVLTAAPPGPAV